MEQKINTILNDLYEIDSSFRAHETELRSLVVSLIEAKPDVHIDEAFVSRLRGDLLKAFPIVSIPSSQPVRTPFFSLFQYNMFSGVAGALIAILVVAPLTYVMTRQSGDTGLVVKNISSGLTFKQQISSNATKNAFGSLDLQESTVADTMSVPALAKTAISEPVSSGALIQEPAATSAMMIAPSQSPVYAYAGDVFDIKETEAKVFKRVKGITSSKQLANFVRKANFGLTNLNSYSDVALQNIQLVEDKPFGYNINVDFNEGMILISPHYAKWNEERPQTESIALKDSEILAVSDSFIKSHGIDLSSYSKPIVTRDSYTQDRVYVTYPLILNGLEVYNQNGSQYGLEIIVDAYNKKVWGVQNLVSQIFESSVYPLNTNEQKSIDQAISGNQGAMLAPQSKKTKQTILELDTPRRVLVRHWLTLESGVTTELYVPALLFPLKNNEVQQNSVIVPLIQEKVSQPEPVATDTVPLPVPQPKSDLVPQDEGVPLQ